MTVSLTCGNVPMSLLFIRVVMLMIPVITDRSLLFLLLQKFWRNCLPPSFTIIYGLLCLLDLRKAFDSLDHVILLQHLAALGVSHHLLKWFQNYCLIDHKGWNMLVSILIGIQLLEAFLRVGPRAVTIFDLCQQYAFASLQWSFAPICWR